MRERPIPTGEFAPVAIAWSADGSSLAFLTPAPARNAAPAWAPPAILDRLRPPAQTRMQVFAVNLGKDDFHAISTGNRNYAGEPTWSLDGRWIFAADDAGEIVALPTAGGAPKVLTKGQGFCENPVVSPDGGRIAYLVTDPKPQSYVVRQLAVMNPDGSRVRVLTGALDRDAADPQWSSDSRTVYFLADDRGATHIYAAHRDGSIRQVTEARERLRGLSVADNGRAATVRSDEVITLPVDSAGEAEVLAAPNAGLLAAHEIGATEEIWVSSDGNQVQAWIAKPPGFDAARKYPLLLDLRDAPGHAGFDLRSQILAAHGFVVLRVNPRGTPGYGEIFGNVLPTGFPKDPFDDLMAAVDAVLAKGYIDPRRVMISGGILASWALGRTDRFARAVVRHPVAAWMNDKTAVLVLDAGTLKTRKVETAAYVDLPEDGRPGTAVLELETMLGWFGAR